MSDHTVEVVMLYAPRTTKWRWTCTCGIEGEPMSRKQALTAGRDHYDRVT